MVKISVKILKNNNSIRLVVYQMDAEKTGLNKAKHGGIWDIDVIGPFKKPKEEEEK